MPTFSNQFGLIVAYLLPGFIGLAGLAPLAPVVGSWLQPLNQTQASLGPPIYALLAATTVGMIVSCFRWLVIDHIHYWTGVKPPIWDDSRLEERLVAFNYLVESHYRYYQFLANSFIAVIWAYAINRLMKTWSLLGIGTDVGILILLMVLFAGSRDTLSKYYIRTGRLVGQVAEKDIEDNGMINGNDHGGVGGSPAKPRPTGKPQSKPKPAPKSALDKAMTSRSSK
jgi:hypothetical protein